MTREDVLQLAAACGIKGPAPARQGFKMYASPARLSLFADAVEERVRKDEREACAKVCEEKAEYSMPVSCPDAISGCLVAHYIPARREKTGSECAAAIRARGEK